MQKMQEALQRLLAESKAREAANNAKHSRTAPQPKSRPASSTSRQSLPSSALPETKAKKPRLYEDLGDFDDLAAGKCACATARCMVHVLARPCAMK